MLALIVKEFQELARERRTIAMLVLLPALLLTIFGYAANFTVNKVSVVVVGSQAEHLARDLEGYATAATALEIVRVDSTLHAPDAERLLRDQEADAVVVAARAVDNAALADRMQVYADGSKLFPAQATQQVFAQLAAEDARGRIAETEEALVSMRLLHADLAAFRMELEQFEAATQRALAEGKPAPRPPSPPTVDLSDLPPVDAPALEAEGLVTVVFNPDLTTSWVMVPGLIGLILLFVGALVTSIGLVRERESGTLEQLAVLPLRPSAIILGKIVPYFLLAVFDTAVITALGIALFSVPFAGNAWLFTLGAVVFLFVVLGLGVLISSISRTTGQAIQLAILCVLPQVLLSGLVFPLDSMPPTVRWLGYALPLTWFRDIAQGVMLRGAGLGTLWLPLTVLSSMALLVFGTAVLRMRRALTHGGLR